MLELAILDDALATASRLAAHGPAANRNPQVGAVILDSSGHTVSTGWHDGVGSPHAEVVAIANAAGADLSGATLVVTLEPCSHVGTTGPCTEAIITAGIPRVVFAATDPGASSSGGADFLRQHGVDVTQLESAAVTEQLHVWTTSVKLGRPFVTLKIASTLDGFVAAADGSSKWITGEAARTHAHLVRTQVGAIAVTTGTVFADGPSLTARLASGELADHQPLAVVVGERDLPVDAKVRRAPGGFFASKSRDVTRLLADLEHLGIRHLLVEGGPALHAAFIRANLVDEIHAYIAPKLLGSGTPSVAGIGVNTISDAAGFEFKSVMQLGDDAFLVLRRQG